MKFFTPLFFVWTLVFLCNTSIYAQYSIPVKIVNTTGLPDDSLFVAIVGEDLSGPPGKFVWVDVLSGQQKPMSLSDNTIDGPVYGGNMGPGGNAKYADCFSPLSSISDQTIPLDRIQGCRIFISQKKQLYLYFFDQISTFGYAAPDLKNINDPNRDIIYEIIELTFDNTGLFANTTRVDAYQRPIRLEMFGEAGAYQEIRGEMANHENIIASFPGSVPSEFQNCLVLSDNSIRQPSKIADFQPPMGVHKDYFKGYVDAIWDKYSNEDLIFKAGEIGIYKGRVDSQDSFKIECVAGSFLGQQGIITRRPNTIEVIEGSGVLASEVKDGTVDLNVQKFVCAAINRHVIDISPSNPDTQIWSDPAFYYQEAPANFYAAFWHQQGISIDELSYGFAYDDVFDQSSSLRTTSPDSLKIYFGNPDFMTSTTSSLPRNLSLKVYPSHTQNKCKVRGLNRSETLKVIDLKGNIVEIIKLDVNQNETEIDLSNYVNGLYIIQTLSKKGIGIAKVVKM